MRTHTHTHTLSLSLTHTRAHTYIRIRIHTHTTHARTHTHTHVHTQTHTPTHMRTPHTRTHTHTHTRAHTRVHTHKHTLTRAPHTHTTHRHTHTHTANGEPSLHKDIMYMKAIVFSAFLCVYVCVQYVHLHVILPLEFIPFGIFQNASLAPTQLKTSTENSNASDLNRTGPLSVVNNTFSTPS